MGNFLGAYMQACIIKILGNNFQQQLQQITKKADAEPKKADPTKKADAEFHC